MTQTFYEHAIKEMVNYEGFINICEPDVTNLLTSDMIYQGIGYSHSTIENAFQYALYSLSFDITKAKTIMIHTSFDTPDDVMFSEFDKFNEFFYNNYSSKYDFTIMMQLTTLKKQPTNDKYRVFISICC